MYSATTMSSSLRAPIHTAPTILTTIIPVVMASLIIHLCVMLHCPHLHAWFLMMARLVFPGAAQLPQLIGGALRHRLLHAAGTRRRRHRIDADLRRRFGVVGERDGAAGGGLVARFRIRAGIGQAAHPLRRGGRNDLR